MDLGSAPTDRATSLDDVSETRKQEDGDHIEVVVARVGKPHGIRGEVTVDLRSDSPERRFAPGARLRVEPPRGAASPVPGEVTVLRSRWHQGTLLLTFSEAADRTAAEGLRGAVLHASIPADETPEDPEEYYDHQLVGLSAHDTDGNPIGVVTAVIHGAAQDLLSIRTPQGRDTLVPFVTALVPEVDLATGRVVIDDRPGLVAPLAED